LTGGYRGGGSIQLAAHGRDFSLQRRIPVAVERGVDRAANHQVKQALPLSLQVGEPAAQSLPLAITFPATGALLMGDPLRDSGYIIQPAHEVNQRLDDARLDLAGEHRRGPVGTASPAALLGP